MKILLIFIFSSLSLLSQYNDTTNKPISWILKNISKLEKVEEKKIMKFNIDSAKAIITENNKNGFGFQFGVAFDVKLNLKNSGSWDTLNSGDFLWRLRVKSDSAVSMNFTFNEFHLSEGCKFYIYDYNKKNFIGPFTDSNNLKSNKFATDVISGNEIVLELFIPSKTLKDIQLEIDRIVHGIFDSSRTLRFDKNQTDKLLTFAECYQNINCPDGDSWCREKRSVCRILNLDKFFSGFLINSFSSSGTYPSYLPYILTSTSTLDINLARIIHKLFA